MQMFKSETFWYEKIDRQEEKPQKLLKNAFFKKSYNEKELQ